jgi:hypothetical protein
MPPVPLADGPPIRAGAPADAGKSAGAAAASLRVVEDGAERLLVALKRAG